MKNAQEAIKRKVAKNYAKNAQSDEEGKAAIARGKVATVRTSKIKTKSAEKSENEGETSSSGEEAESEEEDEDEDE